MERTCLKQEVRLSGEGAGVLDLDGIIAEGRELSRPSMREMQLANRCQAFAKRYVGDEISHQKAAPSGSTMS